MIFTELRFFPFFALAFCVAWALRADRARKTWLLLCSYAFYAAWDWRFLGLIVGSTLLDHLAALRIEAAAGAGRQGARRAWLLASLTGNLGMLGFFKYWDFFAESANTLLMSLGFGSSLPVLNVILPVGISFFTFQTLSYSIDVYRGQLRATRSLLDVGLFVGFFPQLVAGPIVRASEFLPQLLQRPTWASVELRPLLVLFLSGFIKKACVADSLAPFVDGYFAVPAAYDALSSWVAVTFYATQIYCDFSGYSDMAIACAGLLGYRLTDNFRHPYLAASITDFWRRWHISLSTWLRDYLYIPLGGSRRGTLRTQANLMITMLLGGLWHGAAWNFVVWGGLHGLALIVHKGWRRVVGVRSAGLMAWLGPLLTFYWVCVAWVFFRTGSLDMGSRELRKELALDPELAEKLPGISPVWLQQMAELDGLEWSWTILKSFVGLQSSGEWSFGWGRLGIFGVLAVAHVVASRGWASAAWRRLPDWGFALAYGGLFGLAVNFVSGAKAFIYFQF